MLIWEASDKVQIPSKQTLFFLSRNDRQHFGLGLCIAYEIIALHKGSVTIQDTPGGGSTFLIFLPDILSA
ncbi:hypothetical protein GKZ57_10635 [Blautia luti DSM 14534]|uniref:histidine kinase n=1 Tax=Blautia luti DSM 14534 = JCM 17040 TaxID=649762 RepID=A0A844GK52_9FIRM|nr:hypothetical protein [Blautia luti DSM 14534 = JCM 17040]